MADFMGDHIRLSEIAGGVETTLHFVEEAEVEINFFIFGTIERPDGGAGESAGGSNGAGE